MGRLYKRIICIVLALVMAFGASVTAFAEGEQSLEDIIRPQIEAFAKSIDQKDADGKAADAIASHGMFGRGKDLKVGKDHALTATLVNSELGMAYLTESVLNFIETEKNCEKTTLYGFGDCRWNLGKSNRYFLYIYDYDAGDYRQKGYIDVFDTKNGLSLPTSLTQYDESLEWMAGETYVDIIFNQNEIRKEEIICNVKVVIRDTFDFDTSKNSGFIGLISGIGALLFKEFCWYSTFDFQIEIPNDCEHSFSEWKTAAEPNCTEKGREERTCPNCGCVETKETAALGHSFGEWQETKAPTYFEEGEERRTCSNCGHYETRAVGTLEFLLGDVNGDEKVNVLDANVVRKYAAKSAELSEKQLAAADTNGDGSVNVLDANIIRKFAAKIITEFPIQNK